MLSIIIPVYNEEKTLKKVIDEVLKLPVDKEIVVVDDGSTDKTRSIMSSYEKKIKCVYLDKNKGKGYAIRKGLEVCKGTYIGFQDADLEYPPVNLVKRYNHAVKENIDMVVGVRTLSFDRVLDISFGSFFANKVIKGLTGCPDVFTEHRVVKKDVLDELNLFSNGFDIETEITLKVLSSGYSVDWISVDYYPRKKEKGKKIGAGDFVRIMLTYMKLRLSLGSRLNANSLVVEKGN